MMLTCNIVGCGCKGTTAGHHAYKAYQYGFTYYAASYGPRYGDPISTYVSLVPFQAEDAADKAAEFEREDFPFDDIDSVDSVPDICVWGESTYSAKDLFTARELAECRHELLRGEVVCLSR